MSDVLVKPAFQSNALDSGDTTKFGPNAWNAARLFSGGTDGQIVTKSAASATGAAWVDSIPTSRTVNGHALSSDVIVTQGDLGLGNVENTALSTWGGSANLVTLGTIANLAVSTTLVVGANVPSGDDAAILITRSATGSAPHAVRDESAVNAAAGAAGYASFDALPAVSGATAYNHHAGFQARANYNGSGSLAEWRGFWAQPNHSGSGTIANVKMFNATNPAGAGPITHVYGIFVDNLTRGSTDNFAIYTFGSTPSLFGGQIRTAFNANTNGNAVTDGALSIQELSGNKRFMLGYNTTGNYGWLQAANFGVAYNPILINPNGGIVAIGTASPNANAILDLTSTTLAFLPPRMTTTQRDAIATPTAGMVVYNSTTGKLNVRGASAWEAVTSA